MRHRLLVLLVFALPGAGLATKPDDRVVSAVQTTTTRDKLPAATGQVVDTVVNSIGMAFVSISTGTFTRGNAQTAQQVTLTQAFQLGQHEVTQEQYERLMGSNPSHFRGPQLPVDQVSCPDAVTFCQKLSALPAEQAAGRRYRLPTETEWEYACRAGTTMAWSFGNDAGQVGRCAWHDMNAGGTTHPVGGKLPNPWGLYDIHRNLFEWCQDWDRVYTSGTVTDPTGPASGSKRVTRGQLARQFQ